MKKNAYYVGIDLHRNNFVAHITDVWGTCVHKGKYPNTTEAVESLLAVIPKTPHVVIEATRNWMWLVGQLKKKGCIVTLAHPLKTKAIASARIKTDTLDAKVLCHLLRTDMLPPAHIAPHEQQQLREIARGRIQLVKDQTQVKNRIRALLAKENVTYQGDLFGKKGTTWLRTYKLTPARQEMVTVLLTQLMHIQEGVKTIEHTIQKQAAALPEVDLLLSIPSIGLTTAYTIVSEVGDVKRFPTSGNFTSYLGLVPRLSQSGSHAYYGRITKLGNPYMRWSLVQAAHRLSRAEPPYQKFVRRITYKKGKKKAIVALARKLAVIIYHVLYEQRPYINCSDMT